MSSTIVVTVDRTKTVSVERHTPSLEAVVQPGAVATITNEAPRVREVDLETAAAPDVVEVARGPKGDKGERGEPGPAAASLLKRVAAVDLGGHRIVRSAGGQVDYADDGDPAHGDDTLGFTTGAVVAGEEASVQLSGAIEFNGWDWTPGEPVYLGSNGLPTQQEPGGAVYQVVGYAETPTSIVIQIQPPIY